MDCLNSALTHREESVMLRTLPSRIHYHTVNYWTSPLLLAWTDHGLCALFPILDSIDQSVSDLQQYFLTSELIQGEQFPPWMNQVEMSINRLDLPYHGPLDLQGTEFQRHVWQALLTIPAGETRSYSDIAKQIDRPKAVRAVGSACGANPVSILVPCHRVIRSDGSFKGYHWGVEMKTRLLTLEAGLT